MAEEDAVFEALCNRPPHLLSEKEIAQLKISLLYKLDVLERMGMHLPRNHSMESDFKEMLHDLMRVQAQYDNLHEKKCDDLIPTATPAAAVSEPVATTKVRRAAAHRRPLREWGRDKWRGGDNAWDTPRGWV